MHSAQYIGYAIKCREFHHQCLKTHFLSIKCIIVSNYALGLGHSLFYKVSRVSSSVSKHALSVDKMHIKCLKTHLAYFIAYAMEVSESFIIAVETRTFCRYNAQKCLIMHLGQYIAYAVECRKVHHSCLKMHFLSI